jgi:hypothetical protein
MKDRQVTCRQEGKLLFRIDRQAGRHAVATYKQEKASEQLLTTDMKTGRHAIVAYRQVVRRTCLFYVYNQESGRQEYIYKKERLAGRHVHCTVIVRYRQVSCA